MSSTRRMTLRLGFLLETFLALGCSSSSVLISRARAKRMDGELPPICLVRRNQDLRYPDFLCKFDLCVAALVAKPS